MMDLEAELVFPLPDETWDEYAEHCFLHDPLPVAVVPLTRGKATFIDRADLPFVAQYKWYANPHANGRWTARAYLPGSHHSDCNSRYVYMHTLLGGEGPVDHRDRNGLNNTRVNLRSATKSQNGANCGLQSGNTSGFKGVSHASHGEKWVAQIKVEGRQFYLGVHADVRRAARAYDEAAIRYFGGFAVTNVSLGLLRPVTGYSSLLKSR